MGSIVKRRLDVQLLEKRAERSKQRPALGFEVPAFAQLAVHSLAASNRSAMYLPSCDVGDDLGIVADVGIRRQAILVDLYARNGKTRIA